MTYSYEADAKIARVMHEKASISVVLATNRKIGQRDRITAIPASKVDILISDHVDEVVMKSLLDVGIRVISAPESNNNNANLSLVAEQD